jgi:HD-GYP domain-containing protein (c-di-GMP phosphodiesterase class II)
LRRVAEDIRAGNNLKLESVEEVIDDMVESMVRNPDALMWVGRMRERSAGIYDHGLSVAICLVAFGRHLGYPKEALSHLGMMGLLLDIGKIKLPRELLERDARLSSDEFEQIKEHVDLGLEILAETPNLHPDILDGVAQHHERMNGTGYPNNMMGDKISVFGRMSAIADTFSAITKHRPYAEAVSPHQALQMLSNWSGTQFHAEMVEQFIQSIGVFPVGSLVELSTGEVAVVVTHGKLKRLKPKVLVVTEADKTHCKHPALRDLLYDISDNPAHIRRGLPSNSYGIDPSEYYLA